MYMGACGFGIGDPACNKSVKLACANTAWGVDSPGGLLVRGSACNYFASDLRIAWAASFKSWSLSKAR
jgi:hypothetical protein